MKRWSWGPLCVCLVFCFGCSGRKNAAGIDERGMVRLDKVGVSLQLPKGFQPVPEDRLGDLERVGVTVLPVQPFTALPRYGYADKSGKALMIVSELQFSEGVTPRKYPMDNLFIYRNNLAAWFDVDEIQHEEIEGGGITTLLLAMSFTEGEDTISLFKGLCYAYPQRFCMIDLYVINSRAGPEDAAGFQNMFYSIQFL
jgi:hypothetical protein